MKMVLKKIKVSHKAKLAEQPYMIVNQNVEDMGPEPNYGQLTKKGKNDNEKYVYPPFSQKMYETFEKLITMCLKGQVADLKSCIENKDTPLFENLLKNNARDVHTGYNAYEFVAIQGNMDVMLCLYKNYFTTEQFGKAMEYTIMKDDAERARYMIEEMPKLKIGKEMYLALKNGSKRCIDEIANIGDCINDFDEEGYSALQRMCKEGRLDHVKFLMENKADPGRKSNKNVPSPLHFAIKYKHVEIVKYMVNNGADPNGSGYTTLSLAAEFGQLELVKFLLNNGADPTMSSASEIKNALHYSATFGHLEVVKCLLEHKAMNSIMNKRCGKDQSDGPTALHLAIERGHFEIAKYLAANKNVDLNLKSKGWSPLHILAQKGHLETLKSLMEKGADLNAKTEPDEETPLIIAARYEHFDVLKYLVEKKADVNAKCKGQTALHFLAKKNENQIVQHLLANTNKADINVKNDLGETPLMYASCFGCFEVVRTLLQNNADLHVETKDGKTALHLGAKHGYHKIVRLLIDHGANMFHQDSKGSNPLEHLKTTPDSQTITTYNKRKTIDILSVKMKKELSDFSDNYKAILKLSTNLKKEIDLQETKKNFELIVSSCIVGDVAKIREILFQDKGNEVVLNNALDFHTKYRPLDFASMKGHLEVVKCLLDYGAQIDYPETSTKTSRTLDLAIINGHEEVVKCLVEHGAKIGNQLYLAVKKDQLNIAKSLLIGYGYKSNKANIDKVSEKDFNVLHLAAKKNRLDLVKLFISNGADPNVKSGCEGHYRTALHFAAENYNIEMVEYLIEFGADMFCKDINNFTPLDLVKKEYSTYLIDEEIDLTNGENDDGDTKERMIEILTKRMKSTGKLTSIEDEEVDDDGPPRNKRPRLEQVNQSERMVSPLLDSFLDTTFTFDSKIACLHGIAGLMLKDSDILKFLVKKEIIDEIANIVIQIVGNSGNEFNKDLSMIAKILSKINAIQEGKKLIGEMKMSLSAFEKLQTEMRRFENNPDPRQFAFDSDHSRKVKTEIQLE